MDERELFALVDGQLRGQEDRKGQYHVDCPYCGKEAKRGQHHFSYSTSGGFCFVCGVGAGLYGLARHLGLLDDATPPPARPSLPPLPAEPPPDEPAPAWRSWRREEYMNRYYPNATTVTRRWQTSGYDKPVNAADVARHWLGFGVLPGGYDERLVVPLFDDQGRLACLRGRALGRGGWMSPAGWKLADIPLFNLRHATPGCTLVIVENAVDAILLSRHYEEGGANAVAVATLSVSYWAPAWEEAILDLWPAHVLVAYDNDLPGNGITDEDARRHAQEEWRRNKGHEPPTPRGVALANRLQRRGLRAVVYKYPTGSAVGADPGDLIKKTMHT